MVPCKQSCFGMVGQPVLQLFNVDHLSVLSIKTQHRTNNRKQVCYSCVRSVELSGDLV
jgi:hypothetical protein